MPSISVILPVYNVEKYLRECLDSIIGQTFRDFELICIDDGSTDLSGAILDEYSAIDSRIRVVRQPNGGLAAARNTGLPLASGEYIYTCDSDDICHPRLLELMYRRARKVRADVVCCEMSSFDCESGRSLGRFTFPEWVWDLPLAFSGVRVSDELFSLFGSSTCDKLFSRRLLLDNGIRFDEGVRRFTSFCFTALALAFAERISLLPLSLYRYRENRPGSQQSTREKSPVDAFRTRAAVMDRLTRAGTFGSYSLGFMISLVRIARSQLRGTRIPENRRVCFDEMISLGGRVVSTPGFPYMAFASTLEFGYWMSLVKAGGPGAYVESEPPRTFDMTSPWRLELKERIRFFRSGLRRFFSSEDDRTANVRRRFRLKLDFLEIKHGRVCFEGRFLCDSTHPESVFESLELVQETPDGSMTAVRPVDHSHVVLKTDDYGEAVKAWRFSCSFSSDTRTEKVYRWRSIDSETKVSWNCVEHSGYSPFANSLRFSYAVIGGMIYSFSGECLVSRRVGVIRWLVAESLLNANLLKKWSRVAFKALFLRWFVRIVRHVRHRPQWMFSDRFNFADDNGKVMYDYVLSLPSAENPPRAVLALSSSSPQFTELSRNGPVVDVETFRYKLEFLLSECVLSAYHTRRHRLPFGDAFVEYAKDLVLRPKFIQLRHGVCQNDTSATQNRWYDNPSVLLTVSSRERESMLEPAYGFLPEVVCLTGFPRFDLLYDEPKKLITFMPTWRSDLIVWDSNGHHRPAADAALNPFIQNYQAILSDVGFVSACERAGYSICLKGHPNLAAVQNLLNLDPRVRVLDNGVKYREVFAETNLLVTDYSSVAFDFAYLKKPIVYFQFDREKFFQATYRRGYYDASRDGFGPVCASPDELKRQVLDVIAGGCHMDGVFEARVRSFFAHTDKDNCKRVYESVLRALRT